MGKSDPEIEKRGATPDCRGAALTRFTLRMVLGVSELQTCWLLKWPEGRAPFASDDSASEFGSKLNTDSPVIADQTIRAGLTC